MPTFVAASALHSSDAGRASHHERSKEALNHLRRSVTSAGSETQRGHWMVDSAWFNAVITGTVILNTFQLGLEADHPDLTDAWSVCENVVTGIFFIEMISKLFVKRLRYFNDKSNWLDAVLTILGVVDCWVLQFLVGNEIDLQSMSALRVVRLVRLVRVAKVAGRIRPLMLIITGLYHALTTTFWVILVLFIVIYVFAVFCTEHIGHGELGLYPGFSSEDVFIDQQEVMLNFNPYIMFGNMGSSMLTLFNIAIGSEWQEVVRPLAIKQPLLVLLFLPYCVVIVFGIMNVIIAIVVDNVIFESKKMEMKTEEHIREGKRQLLEQIQEVLGDLDTNHDGSVDLEELDEAFQSHSVLQQLLLKCNLPAGWTAPELLMMLDISGDGSLQHAEFTTNLYRLMDGDSFQISCVLQYNLNEVKHLLRQSHEKLELQIAGVAESLRQCQVWQSSVGDVGNSSIASCSFVDPDPAELDPTCVQQDSSLLVESDNFQTPAVVLDQDPQVEKHASNSWGKVEVMNQRKPLRCHPVHDDIAWTNANRAASANPFEEIGAGADAVWQELRQDMVSLPFHKISDSLDVSYLALKKSFYRDLALLQKGGDSSSISQMHKANTALQAMPVIDSGQDSKAKSHMTGNFTRSGDQLTSVPNSRAGIQPKHSLPWKAGRVGAGEQDHPLQQLSL